MHDGLVDLLRKDVSRLGTHGWLTAFKQYLLPRGGCFRYVLWLRLVAAMRKKVVLKYTIGLVAYLIFRHYEYKYGIHANPNIRIGGG